MPHNPRAPFPNHPQERPDAYLDRLPPGFAERKARVPKAKCMRGQFQEHDGLGNTILGTCKCCGEVIQAWVPIGDPIVRHVEGGRIVQETPMGFLVVAAHAQIVLEMEEADGRLSKHVSAFCKGCATGIIERNDPEELEAAYLADIEAGAHVDEAKGIVEEQVRHVRSYMLTRKPKRALGLEQVRG